MKHKLQIYGNERCLAFCAFCGGETGTRNHYPSRVFLDEPFPDNLPVVPACSKCRDRQYSTFHRFVKNRFYPPDWDGDEMGEIKKEIQAILQQLEQEKGVCIFYACESGSRAWGFPSADSDYDVRFLYIHPKNWYLTIDEKRDVIERPDNDLIDLNGWDIRKALKLFRKSNPPLLEWLNSPIIYQQRLDIANKIKALIPEYYYPKSCLYHYLHMAEGNFREYLKGEIVWVKKYFYVLRPILACKWIEAGYGVVPMEFEFLVDRMVTSRELKEAIRELLERKKEGQELDKGSRIPIISEFIEAELERLRSKKYEGNSFRPNAEKLDELFRWSLEVAWAKTAA